MCEHNAEYVTKGVCVLISTMYGGSSIPSNTNINIATSGA